MTLRVPNAVHGVSTFHITYTLCMREQRIKKLQQFARDARLDFVAIVPGMNMVYFTGLHMHASERPIVMIFAADAQTRPAIIVPGFEVGKAMNGPIKLDWQVFSYADGVPYQQPFDQAAQALGLSGKTVGVEPRAFRFLEHSLLSAAAQGVKIVSAEQVIEPLRAIKDADEIAATRRAIQLTEQVLADVLEEIKPGMTEREIAGMLSTNALRRGAMGVAFSPLVQAGLSAAFPHGNAGDRKVQMGDVLLIDFGYTMDDYPADITRTVVVGTPSAEIKRIYETVKAANAAARAIAKPGSTCQEVDRAARAVIEAAGYGKYFTHRTGHGLGLEGHEAPYIVEGNATVLQPGMMFTIEPGVYIEGVGGVRIEDNVVITETGHDCLTTFERELISI
jgi:Xaa-Pro dipeptidase